MNVSLKRWAGYTKWWTGQAVRAVVYRLPTPWSQRTVSEVWENWANMIHERWGNVEHDYEILSRLFTTYEPQSILDVGCGSGRLFKLYAQHGIQDVVGIDISAQALSLARQRYPTVSTIHSRLENLTFPPERFDLAICNRVLQHLPPHTIDNAIAQLCKMCRLIYINELTESDDLSEEFYMFRHNYLPLFVKHKFTLYDEGKLGEQTYQIYGPAKNS
jgi:ubiquinone/menaquinone biosynthesis C-methylase UbiE